MKALDEMTSQLRVLLVSEDPAFIHRTGQELQPRGAKVVGCLGPAHTHCVLEDGHSCPLAAHATIAVVDSPPSGSFTRHMKGVRSSVYAQTLQRTHPDCTVILSGAPEGEAGPTGEIISVTNTASALVLLDALVASWPEGSLSFA